jgi:uncharacterized membrane protein
VLTELGAFLARFHPLIVHVPIGALIVGGVLEGLARTKRFAGVRPAVAPIVVLGAMAALVAAGTGFLLGSSGGYAGPTFEWHLLAGFGVAFWSAATAFAYTVRGRVARPVLAPVLLVLALPLVLVAGHLGGTLTHGEGYLTERLPSWLGGRRAADRQPRVPAEVRVYAELVQPALANRCGTCHGAVQPAGELRLDTPEGLRKGGHSGPAIVPGRAASSEIVRRVWLPASHKDAMPPGGQRPLTVPEAAILRWWIDQGARFDATLGDLDVDAGIRPVIDAMAGPLRAGAPAILAVKVPAADPAALARVRALGVSVEPLATGTPFLSVHCTNVAKKFGDAELAQVAVLAPQVTWLSLSGTAVTDAGLAKLSSFTNLTRLHLDHTRVTDAGLASLSGLARLEYLNLYGTAVTDTGLARLERLGELRDLYVWQTGVTPTGAERLRTAIPRLNVVLGAEAPARSYDADARNPEARSR